MHREGILAIIRGRMTRDPLPRYAELCVLLGLALVVYLPRVLHAEFLNFDDNLFFGPQNQAVLQGGLGRILDPTQTILNVYLPVSHLSLYIDLMVFGANPLGAHLHSLLLQVLAAFCLSRLLARLGLGPWQAVIAAAVFLVHPALTESTMWVSGRKELLSGLFSFLCLSACVDAVRAERVGPKFALAFVFAILALYSKGTALVLPLLVPVVVLVAGANWKKTLGISVAVSGFAVAIGMHHIGIASHEGTLVISDTSQRLMQVPGVYLHYFWRTISGQDLNVLYPEKDTMDAFASNLLWGILLVLLLGGIAFATLKKRPLVSAGILMWGLALTPFNTAFPASSIAAADRYLYLAIPGFVLVLAGVHPRLGTVVTGLYALVFAVLANQRAADFENSGALWDSSLAQNRSNAVAHLNRANVLEVTRQPLADRRRAVEEAAAVARYPQHRYLAESTLSQIAELEALFGEATMRAVKAAEALEELPRTEQVDALRLTQYLRAARLARGNGRDEVAAVQLEKARTIDASAPAVVAHDQALALSRCSDAEGHVDIESAAAKTALSSLEKAIAEHPSEYELYLVRGQWAVAGGELLAADRYFRLASKVQPRRAEAYVNSAQLFLSEGLFDDAEKAARSGLAAGVRDPGLIYCMGLSLGGQGKLSEARIYYEQYLNGRPKDRAARIALAAVLAAQAMPKLHQLSGSALDEFADRVQELDPSNPKAYLLRGVARRQEKKLRAALVLFEKAAEGLPGDPEVNILRAQTYRDRGWRLMMQSQRDLAMDHFRKFLDIAPPGIPTEAVLLAVRNEWKLKSDAARLALIDEDLDRADRLLRRCIELLPREVPHMLAGFVQLKLWQRDKKLAEAGPEPQRAAGIAAANLKLSKALTAFEAAEQASRLGDEDCSGAVYYQVITCFRQGRPDEARARGLAYLKAVGKNSAAKDLDRIRYAIER